MTTVAAVEFAHTAAFAATSRNLRPAGLAPVSRPATK
jgi:hypothetical protein